MSSDSKILARIEKWSAWGARLLALTGVLARVSRLAGRRPRPGLTVRQRSLAAHPKEGQGIYRFEEHACSEELRRIEKRRKLVRKIISRAPGCASSPQQTVGLALSGGGIRSATFSLGVLQSLAKNDLLPRIDYLSTVSGGGYAGCYLGSLFLPDALRQVEGDAPPTSERLITECERQCRRAYKHLKKAAVPTAPSPACAGVRSMLVKGSAVEGKAPTTDWSIAKTFEWLRNNGRFLAPRGAGDLIYVVAMQIRNWVAVQYVVGVMIMFLLVAFSTGRAWMIALCPIWQRIEVQFLPKPGAAIYWSPGWVLVGAFGALFLLPPALAYWLAHSRIARQRELSWIPLWHEGAILFLLLLGLTYAYSVLKVMPSQVDPMESPHLPYVLWAAVAYVFISLCAIGTFAAGLVIERRGVRVFKEYVNCFVWGAVVLLALWISDPGPRGPAASKLVAFIVIVSLGEIWVRPGVRETPDLKSLRTRFTKWLSVTFRLFLGAAGLALLGTIGQTVYAYVRLDLGAGRAAGLTSLVGAIVAGARLLFKWMGSGTKRAHPLIPLDAMAGAAAVLLLLVTGGAWATLVQAALWKGGDPPASLSQAPHAGPRTWKRAPAIQISPWDAGAQILKPVPLDSADHAARPVAVAPGWMLILFGGVSFLFVTTGMFLNFINMSSLHQFYAARLTRAYLGASNRARFHGGSVVAVTSPLRTDRIRLDAYYHPDVVAPVHLINVTVNQTRPPEGQLVQRDRKGMSMAIGPKYTVVNSAIFEREENTGNLTPMNADAATLAGQDASNFEGPDRPRPRTFGSEELDLGDWCAISGAAFSTGLGMRTSLGLSLLAGLSNVRLGYWWNFNSDRWGSWFLAAYRYLWGELMADFKGPWKPFWFLTDGGHFDNTGVYELVRRRVGTILLCDNGCDPDYQFDDLGNLARKIRTDFGAELRPVQDLEGLPKHFAKAKSFATEAGRAGKCALLYEIEYPRDAAKPPRGVGEHSPDRTLLIVLKPNMIPKLPIDVAEYAAANPEFPHQSTLDQFFDEAQWESYRRLGEQTADVVLTADALSLDGWRVTRLPPQT